MLLYFGYLSGYKEFNIFINSKNLFFAFVQLNVININIINNLILKKIVQIFIFIEYSIFFFLSLVFKQNKSFKKIYYLLYLFNSLINNYITLKFFIFFYLFL